MAEEGAEEVDAAVLVPTMKRFAEDFATAPWAYLFDTNQEFTLAVRALLQSS